MLHAMRRNAFLGGLVRILVWAAFVIIPAWLYLQYLAPMVQQLTTTVNQAQTTGAKAQIQMAEWQKALLDLEAKIPGLAPKK